MPRPCFEREPIDAVDLLPTADNPVPAGATILPVTTSDGIGLRAALWPARRAEPRGTVLLMQGRAEFIEKYFEVIGELLDRGFAVATFDWRGQGGSARSLADGHKGHVRHFDDFRHDVEAINLAVLQPLMPKPVIGLAHSMGGCIALLGAAEGWLPVDRLLASTPMIGLSLVRQTRLVRLLAGLLHRLGLGDRFVPGGQSASISTAAFDGNRLCRDPRRYGRNAAIAKALGSGAIGSPTVGWLRAAYEAMDRFAVPGLAKRITIPVLVLGAGDDPVCSTLATERFARELPPGSYLLVDGSHHEVMMEQDEIRALFWDAFDAFTAEPRSERAVRSAAQALEDHVVQAPVAAGDDRASLGRRSAVP